jgi:hypothetical protein
LAQVIMSGVTPNSCAANAAPVRPKARDDFVEDEQDAVLVADLAQPLEVTLRRQHHAGGTGNGLDDDSRNRRRIVQRHQAFEIVASSTPMRRQAARERVAFDVVRVREVVDARESWRSAMPCDSRPCHPR